MSITEPILGHHRLDRLQPEHIERFYAEPRAEGLSSATILQAHRFLSGRSRLPFRARGSRGTSAPWSMRRAWHRKEIEPLSADEARRLLEAAKLDRNAARGSVALAFGLRQGETLGLTWNDIDFAAGSLIHPARPATADGPGPGDGPAQKPGWVSDDCASDIPSAGPAETP